LADLPGVSVVVPCFNSGAVLREAVFSARQQTHPQVEVIVVDDGSTDTETLKVLDEVAAQGVRVVRQDNAGPGAARNAAIASATKPFILPLDADDRLALRAAEIGARQLVADPAVGIVAGAMRLIGAATGRKECGYTGPESMLHGTTIPNISMFRRTDWEEVGGYPESIRRGEDWAFWMRLLALGREVSVLPDDFYEYRVSRAQATARVDPVASAAGSNFVLNENREVFGRYPDALIDDLLATRMLLAQFRRTYGRQERVRATVRRLLRR
jgi:glycosyltransferase involved in cell wall biosynthesis